MQKIRAEGLRGNRYYRNCLQMTRTDTRQVCFGSHNELARTIAGMLGFDLKPVYMPGRPQEVRFAACSADKARRMLGYRTEYTLEEGIGEMVRYIRDRGVKKFRYHLPLEIVSGKTPRIWKEKLF